MRAAATLDIAGELYRYRQLLWSLTWRDVRVRYRQSLLGIGWAVLLPLAMMLVFTFVFTRAIDARSVLSLDIPYPLFAYAGLVPWTFFSQSLTACVNSLVANRNLVTKVYFPREVFPLSSIAACLLDFLIAMSVLFGLMAWFNVRGTWEFGLHATLALVPLVVAVQIMFTTGLGMILAMANLFYRDVRPIVSVGVQLWMFLSAVVVPIPRDGSLTARLIALNPLVPLMEAYRDCLLFGRLPQWSGLAYAGAISTILLVFGWRIFRRASHRFAECI